MTWFDVLAPVMVIGLMGMILYFIMSSEAISRGRRHTCQAERALWVRRAPTRLGWGGLG